MSFLFQKSSCLEMERKNNFFCSFITLPFITIEKEQMFMFKVCRKMCVCVLFNLDCRSKSIWHLKKFFVIHKSTVALCLRLCLFFLTFYRKYAYSCYAYKKKLVYKQFVQNRVREVRELTKTNMWYHLPGKEIIADLPSKECLPEELSSKRSNFINGPSWLPQEISTWPVSKDINRFTNKEEEEFIKTEMQILAVSTIKTMEKKLIISVENVIDPY